MNETFMIGLTTIILLGVGATWLAWRLKLPSILLLLLAGFLVGPVTGFLDTDALLGDILFPFVSFAVAIILYEGGLTLNFKEIRQYGNVVVRLITLGVLATWVVSTIAARSLLGLNLEIALLLGTILVVTGPTVVGPLLQQVRPKGQVGSTLKWEGILIDPVGALLAVLMFEIILAGELGHAPAIIATGVLGKMAVGVIIGFLAAGLMLLLLKRFLIPDHLQNGVSIMVVLLAFSSANLLQEESGLVAVTLMGIILANQSIVPVKHIERFKEDLRVMLIATLFILLSARLSWADISSIGPEAFVFLAVLIFIARPLAVLISTIGSKLTLRDRIFMSWMAPRGIVAAAISSIFAFRLIEDGVAGAERLMPLTFFVIVGTVFIYSLTAKPLARLLGVADENPQGVLFMGAHALGREMAMALQAEGVVTALIDSNWHNISEARMAGLTAYYGNAYSEHAFDEIDFNGIGRFLALTGNEEANALASLHFAEIFGRSKVYHVATQGDQEGDIRKKAPLHLSGRVLFNEQLTISNLTERLEAGDSIKATNITATFDVADYWRIHPQAAPLFLLREGILYIFSPDEALTPVPGDLLFSLTKDSTSTSSKAPKKTQAELMQEA